MRVNEETRVWVFTSSVALDGYRRTVNNDNNSSKLETLRRERAVWQAKVDAKKREDSQQQKAESDEKTQDSAVRCRHQEAAVEHKLAVEAYTKNPSDYRKNEMDRAKQKLDQTSDDVQELKK